MRHSSGADAVSFKSYGERISRCCTVHLPDMPQPPSAQAHPCAAVNKVIPEKKDKVQDLRSITLSSGSSASGFPLLQSCALSVRQRR